MNHKAIYNVFLKSIDTLIPESNINIQSSIDVWFPNGRSSIRIRFKNHYEIVYTYNSQNDWSVETVDSYMKRMGMESRCN